MLRGAKAIARLIAALVLLAGAGTLTWFAALPTAQAQTITDHDRNDNGLIDITNIAQLNAIRHDPNGDGVATDPAYGTAFPDRATTTGAVMGCPAGACTGYELTGNLTFAATSSWTPIDSFGATLDGAGHTMTGLNINVSSGNAGLLRNLTANARVRDLGLINANVTTTDSNAISSGILAGEAAAGVVISNVYAQGGRITLSGNSAGTSVGGLVGELRGALRASYSTAAVTLNNRPGLTYNNRPTGGLVGRCTGCAITASYAAGLVVGAGGTNTTNGLVGGLDGAGLAGITNSYCDTQATGQSDCISPDGNSPSALLAIAANTAQLQTPTGYTGRYLNWNLDTDSDGLPNYPWNFGTSGQYPTLYTPDQRAAVTPATMDYDADDNDRIEIHNLAQLHALRWDTDGDGSPGATNTPAYSTVFAGHTADMGCNTTCNGYELAADLTFPAAAGPYNPWTPIPTYNSILDGQGHSIANLKVEHDDHAGLFAELGGSSAIRNLALVNPRVTSTSGGRGAGSLAGQAAVGAAIENIAVHGGRITSAFATTTSLLSSWAGGLVGRVLAGAAISNSHSSAEVATPLKDAQAIINLGGLVGNLAGGLTNTYAYGRITQPAAGSGLNIAGGLVGNTGATATSTASYCDLEVNPRPSWPYCIGNYHPNFGSTTTSPFEKTTEELQTPTGYTGIYQTWAPADTSTPLWDFGGPGDYPALWFAPRGAADSPPPGGPRYAQPPQDTPYDPAADHPEIYVNDRYEMAATCEVQTGADGAAESSRISFELGSYQGAVILHLAIWNGEFFMSYESQDIPMPDFQRHDQTATVRVTTDPAQTRFLLDSVSPTTNLVLGYADCHTDDPGAADAADPAESATTSTEATPPPPKAYVNDQHEMTATCEVQRNADGEPDEAVIRFDLGRYEGAVILHLSLWNGEYYASYESLGIDVPSLQRNGQSATVQITTNPTQTRFLLDSVSPTSNLLLGYADCHTAGQ